MPSHSHSSQIILGSIHTPSSVTDNPLTREAQVGFTAKLMGSMGERDAFFLKYRVENQLINKKLLKDLDVMHFRIREILVSELRITEVSYKLRKLRALSIGDVSDVKIEIESSFRCNASFDEMDHHPAAGASVYICKATPYLSCEYDIRNDNFVMAFKTMPYMNEIVGDVAKINVNEASLTVQGVAVIEYMTHADDEALARASD